MIILLILAGAVLPKVILHTSKRNSETRKPSSYLDVAHQIKAKTAKELEKEFGLLPCGFGGGAMDAVRTMALMVDVPYPVTIDEARQLALDSQEIFRNNINSNKTIRPYLIEYPRLCTTLSLSRFALQR